VSRLWNRDRLRRADRLRQEVSPPPIVDAPATPVTIDGRERIGWDQPASDSVELATISYAIYVDGSRIALTGVLVCARRGHRRIPLHRAAAVDGIWRAHAGARLADQPTAACSRARDPRRCASRWPRS